MLSPHPRPPERPHCPTDHELRRAYLAAKHLAEVLEVCDLPDLRAQAIAIRQRIFELRNELDREGVVDRP